VKFDTSTTPDITVAVRMNPGNRTIRDYYLLPHLDFNQIELLLAEKNGFDLDAYRFEALAPLYGLAARTPVRRSHV
jgi:hypothetical protein